MYQLGRCSGFPMFHFPHHSDRTLVYLLTSLIQKLHLVSIVAKTPVKVNRIPITQTTNAAMRECVLVGWM